MSAATGKPLDVFLDALRAHQHDPEQNGRGWKVRCPAHEDEHPSLDIDLGDDGKVLLICRSKGCSAKSIVESIGLKEADLFPSKSKNKSKDRWIDWNHRTGNFIYLYADRSIAYRVERFPVYDRKGGVIIDKEMPQSRPDGKGGWIKGRGGIEPILYNLPEISQADPTIPVHIVEGEGKADRLMLLGRLATCNTGGQGKNKWKDFYSEILRGRDCLYFPDNDQPGREHGQRIAQSLYGKAASVKVVELPNLPHKGDVIDFLDAGGTIDQLDELAGKAELWKPVERDKTCNGSNPGSVEKSKREPVPTHAEILLGLASSAELFHSLDQRCFARIEVNGHHETHEIKSTGFGRWLGHAFYNLKHGSPSAEALQSARATLEARATFDGSEREVRVRVADGADGRIYIDLGGPTWEAIEVAADGWKLIADPPVRFIRPKGLYPLPRPDRGGSLESMRKFLTVGDDDWLLFIAWMTQALRPTGPYPVLTLAGEQGSAKSTTAKIARSFLDPHVAMLRSEPRENRDLMISACNGWVIALDNISYLSDWLSDGICRLATGGGLAIRSNYTDTEETFLDAVRPVVIASIEDVVRRGDLADRCITLTLQAIPDSKRRTEAEMWSQVNAVAPEVMGAILDAVAAGLKTLAIVKLDRLPRMADFAVWGEAVCRGQGKKPGEFLAVYASNRQQASETVLEESLVAHHLRAMMASTSKWTGTARELLDELGRIAGEKVVQSKRWPKNPRAFSGALRRLAPSLRTIGIMVDFTKEGHSKTRTIAIEKVGTTPPESGRDFASAPSFASATEVKPSKTEEMAADATCGRKTAADANVGSADAKQKTVESASNQGKKGSADGADHADAKKQPVSGTTRKLLGFPYSPDGKPPF